MRFFIHSRTTLGLIFAVVFATASARAIDIASIEDLQRIGNDPAYPLNGSYALTQDIDASATATWNGGAGFNPIGGAEGEETPFTGTFDGQNHVIANLAIHRPGEDHVGLFGLVSSAGEIINLGIEGGAVLGSGKVGGIVGQNGFLVMNCHATCTVSGSQYVGGLVGENNAGGVLNCYATGAVSASVFGGGLVGLNDGGGVTNCYATGTVRGYEHDAYADQYIGGLVGQNYDGGIMVSYAVGAVSGDSYVGGLVGSHEWASSEWVNKVSNCYARGAVSGNQYIGGLAGQNYNAIVTHCYATGAVSGSLLYGGLVGANGGTVSASFWDVETSGQALSAGGTGLITAQMTQQSTYTDALWDFGDGWAMQPGGYPYIPYLGSPADPAEGEGGACSYAAFFESEWPLIAADLGLNEGISHRQGHIPERWTLVLVQAVLCDPFHPYHNLALNAYVHNLAALENEAPEVAARVAPYKHVLAALLLTTQRREGYFAGLLGLGGNYEVVTMVLPTKAIAEPFSDNGDLDGDGQSNASEYDTIVLMGGSLADFASMAALGDMQPPEMPSHESFGLLALMLALVLAYAFIGRRVRRSKNTA